MKYLYYFIPLLFLFIACSEDDSYNELPILKKSQNNEPIVFNISTYRTIGNIDDVESGMLRSSTGDPFTDIREVESSESIVLPELIPHIWVSNILRKSSIADMQYKPLIFPRYPITVSTTLPNSIPGTIDKPSFSTLHTYIQNQINTGSFSQNGEFSMTVEQFTSYNELKVAFGSNVNTSSIFWGSSSTTDGYDNTISKATGLYVKFYQTSFKAVMDYPTGKLADIPANLIDSSVYINSISYGRLGIMTLETNYTSTDARTMTTKIFNKFFVNGSSTLTQEEQQFLDGSEFKLYLIGGNGKTSVESFSGYLGFINHIKKGTFSKSEPGAPLFCTFAHVNDNSPVSIRFKYNIRKQPIYVEMVKEDNGLRLNFFQNQNRVPTIAHPRIEFLIRKTTEHWRESPRIDTTYNKFISVQNAGYQISMLAIEKPKYYYVSQRCIQKGRERDCDNVATWKYTYTLENGPNYVVIGKNSYP